MENRCLKAALEYCDKGFCVIPIKPTIDEKTGKIEKKPFIAWKKYQTEKSTQEEINRWWKQWPDAMIGLVTGKTFGLCVVDLDKYKPHYDSEKALCLIPDSLLTPTAISPNKGEHLYFRFPEEEENIEGVVDVIPGIDVRATGNYIVAPPSVNVLGKSYQWLPGMDLFSFDLSLLPAPILECCKRGGPRGGGIKNETTALTTTNHEDHNRPQMFTDGRRDNDLFHAANCLVKGGMPKYEIEQVLERLIISWGEKPDQKWIEAKVESALKRAETKERNLTAEIRDWLITTKGNFLTTECHKDLDLTTKDHKKACMMALLRFEKEGLIQKYGEKRGSYRIVDDTDREMEFIEKDILEYNIKLPFGLNDLCAIYPKNIIVMAGSKSAGKTSVVLWTAIHNMFHKNVVYFNSEMGDVEWSNRLKAFGISKKSDLKYKTFERTANFHDKIDGSDTIFIVDFLEIYGSFYEIGKYIRDIHEKLDQGVCLIAVQKDAGVDLGRGKGFSMEKARLYMTMDFNDVELHSKLVIKDAKNSKINMSANGLFKRIKITNHGATMESLDRDWRRR